MAEHFEAIFNAVRERKVGFAYSSASTKITEDTENATEDLLYRDLTCISQTPSFR